MQPERNHTYQWKYIRNGLTHDLEISSVQGVIRPWRFRPDKIQVFLILPIALAMAMLQLNELNRITELDPCPGRPID
jgi:hypothetical protein